jgi:outer membrane protein assembly factor BamB
LAFGAGMLLRDGRTLLVPVFAHGVYCFNMSVGAAGDAAELLWIRPLAGSLEHDVGVDEARGRVYAGSYAQDMTAIDLKTGAVVWTVGIASQIQESSPVIDSDGWVMGAALFFFFSF